MRTVSTTIYSINELSSEAKQKALETFADINTHYNWWDITYENFIEEMKDNGINLTQDDINFSGFHSQGDGASFVCSDFDLEKLSHWVDKLFETDYGKYIRLIDNAEDIELELELSRYSHRYYHSDSVSLSLYPIHSDLYKYTADMIKVFEEQLWDCLKEAMQNLYKTLETEYEYFTSEEQIIDTVNDMGVEFTEDGNEYRA